MDKKLAGLIGLFFLGFTVFVSLIVFGQPIARFTRATNATVSSSRSLLFVWPLKAKADGEQTVNIDVFVRSNTGSPVTNKQVVVQSSVGTVTARNAVSDENGKASFAFKSTSPGVATISAAVDSSPIEQSLSVTFE